jgi:hypothetical protein
MGKRRVGARFFGVGVRALHGTMANHNHRHFARAAGIRPPAEPPALLACPVRGGREPGLGEEEKMGADYFIAPWERKRFAQKKAGTGVSAPADAVGK